MKALPFGLQYTHIIYFIAISHKVKLKKKSLNREDKMYGGKLKTTFGSFLKQRSICHQIATQCPAVFVAERVNLCSCRRSERSALILEIVTNFEL